MAKIDKVDITTIAAGALAERANDALAEVIENVLDPNTDPVATRSVTLTMKIKPMDGRELVTYNIVVKTKMAPPKSVAGVLFIGMENGQARAWEKDPDQVELNLNKANEIIKEEKTKND